MKKKTDNDYFNCVILQCFTFFIYCNKEGVEYSSNLNKSYNIRLWHQKYLFTTLQTEIQRMSKGLKFWVAVIISSNANAFSSLYITKA